MHVIANGINIDKVVMNGIIKKISFKYFLAAKNGICLFKNPTFTKFDIIMNNINITNGI